MAVEIFRFSGEQCDWTETDQKKSKNVLGGKGAALVLMAQAGMPVPPGFTIPTTVCNELTKIAAADKDGAAGYLDALMEHVEQQMKWLEEQFGYMPLVSVRSGAPVSMPGMMDTILNVGLTSSNFAEWAKRLGMRAAVDSQRRLIQMLGATAYGVPSEVFEFQLAKMKKKAGVEADTDLDAGQLQVVVADYLAAFAANKGFEFPIDDPDAQLRAAIKAVFESWMNERAIEYRKMNKIDEAMGTAVNVQAMVFGNMGDDSGTGVLFTRNPSTGSNEIMGEFLQNAQGEDVVAGIRTPRPLEEMDKIDAMWGGIATQIQHLCIELETMYCDMVDVEFTVQQGKLFILQSRAGKRSARAAFKIATDLVSEKMITKEVALSRLTREQFKVVRRPSIDPSFKKAPDLVGLPACPGVVSGKPVFSSEDAVNCKEPCILITHETTPDDIKGMAAELAGEFEAIGQRGGEPFGQQAGQGGAERRPGAGALRRDQPIPGQVGQEVDLDRLAMPPIGRDLEDRGARQAAVGEQRGLPEDRAAGPGDDLRRHAGKGGEQGVFLAQGQRHERGPRLHHLQAELPGQVVGEAGRAELGDRGAAGRDDQRRRADAALPRRYPEPAVGMVDRADRRAARQLHPAPLAFRQEHGDDLAGRAVAEQLPQRLLVPGDAVPLHQVEEIARRVAAERRLGEMRVGREIAVRRGPEIGEVAAPAAGDEDLPARLSGVVEHQHPPAPLPRHRRAHQPGPAGAEHDRVELSLHHRDSPLGLGRHPRQAFHRSARFVKGGIEGPL